MRASRWLHATALAIFAGACMAQIAHGQETVKQLGFTGGALTIPFKFHVNDKSLSGGGTLGGYVGYRTQYKGLTLTPIASAGLTMTDSKYGSGLSLASGWIGSIGASNMHFGLVYGVDWYSQAVKYPYNGKLWLAVEVGYNFGQ